MSLYATGNQTVGPYLHIGLDWLVTTGDGLIEIWQANAQGKYAHPEDRQKKPLQKGWRGFGRAATDARGGFRFRTIKPGPVPGAEGELQAPHLVVSVFMRGMLKHLATRIYFPDEAANTRDALLKLVPPARRGTLIARQKSKGALEWNVILQGKNETVFFDF